MHLLVCLKMFEAGRGTRFLVIAAQLLLTPMLMVVYTVHPRSMHRFVGYLEETAVETYSNIVDHIDMPGSHLHVSWANMPAPDIAKSYWNLSKDATWKETLRHILADEAHHRDVNHAFAELDRTAASPFVHEHVANFNAAVERRRSAYPIESPANISLEQCAVESPPSSTTIKACKDELKK